MSDCHCAMLFVALAALTPSASAASVPIDDGATGLAVDKEAVRTAARALVAAFESCLGADPSATGVVLDVGANNGRWSDMLMTSLSASVRRRTRLLMFEPQPRFVSVLAALTNQFENVLHLPVAAWTNATNLTFHLAKVNSETASLSKRNARRYGNSEAIQVRSVDLARSMRDELTGKACALLKLDVEGAEYRLIPHLLVTGALCLPTHLFVEWHLNSVPEPERLAALALRLSLPATLDTCATPPRVHVNDDYALNNLYTRVPGLDALATLHEGSHSNLTEEGKLTVRKWGATHRRAALPDRRR